MGRVAAVSSTSRNGLVRVVVAAMAAVLIACGVPGSAFAASSAFDDGAGQTSFSYDEHTGNAFVVGSDVRNQQISGDLYWAGQTLNASGIEVGTAGGSALLAGQRLSISDATVHGSLRAAGQDVSVAGVKVGQNITIAGEHVTIDSGVAARGVYVAASSIDVAGSYAGGSFAGGTVRLSGTFDGDVQVRSDSIVVTKDAVVKGTLSVPVDAQVTVEDGAQVATTQRLAAAEDPLAGSLPVAGGANLVGLAYSCVAHVLLGLLFWLLFKNAIRRATIVVSTGAGVGRSLLWGLLVFVCAPIAVVVLLLLVVTAPIAALLAAFMALTWAFSIPFVGFVLGRAAFKKLDERLAGVLGVLILTVLCYVPYLFFVVPTLSAICAVGLLVQMRRVPSQPDPPTAPPQMPAGQAPVP